jgi:translation initiation factor eIF-2B subunit alpha
LHVAYTEGRPDNTGAKVAKELLAAGIPVTLILDSGVGFIMEKVDMLLVGAEGVVESGGIINYIGTFQAALVARSMNKPVYVAAESYKVCALSNVT